MFWIVFIKVILVLTSIGTLGILPLLALLNQWIWNTLIAGNIISCANQITSFWIILGFTLVGSSGLLSLYDLFKK